MSSAPPLHPRPLPIDRRSILRLAWPVILTNLLTSGVSWIDLLMVSHLGKETVAAVGLATFLQTLLWTILTSVQIGVSIVVAQAWGAGERAQAEKATGQAIGLSVVVAAAMSVVLCLPTGSVLLRGAYGLLDAEPAVAEIGARFLRIVLLVLPAFALSLVGQAALRATGNTRAPLWITGAANVVNASVNYVLISGRFGAPALGVEGAAVGTVVARLLEAAAYTMLLRHGRFGLALRLASLAPERATLARLLRLGLPAGGEQLVVTTGFLLYNRAIGSYGTEALASYQIGVILLQASFMPGFGFSVAATTLVGQRVGAGDTTGAREAGLRCNVLAVAMMSAMGLAFFFLARPFARFVLDDDAVVPQAVLFTRLLAISQPAMAMHFALAGALRGGGDVRSPLFASLLAIYGARLGVSFAAAYVLGKPLEWLWWAMVADHHLRAAVLWWRYGGSPYQRPKTLISREYFTITLRSGRASGRVVPKSSISS
jgi:putative MATE family efflux protein